MYTLRGVSRCAAGPGPRCREGTPGGEGPLGRRRRAGVTPSPFPLPRAEGSHGSAGIEWRGSSDGLCPGALLSPAGRGTVASGLGTFPGSTAPCGRVRLPARPVLTREPEFQKYTRESRLFPRRCGVVRVGGEAAPWSPARPPWAPGRVRAGPQGRRSARAALGWMIVRARCAKGATQADTAWAARSANTASCAGLEVPRASRGGVPATPSRSWRAWSREAVTVGRPLLARGPPRRVAMKRRCSRTRFGALAAWRRDAGCGSRGRSLGCRRLGVHAASNDSLPNTCQTPNAVFTFRLFS